MVYKKRKRRPPTLWKVVRRCVVFFTTICIIPVVLVLLVTTDQYLRPIRANRLSSRPEMDQYYDVTTNGKASLNSSIVQKRLDERRKFLKQACKNFGLDIQGNDSLHKPNPWEFLVNKRHHLVWCNVFKAASTSWMYNFNLLAGYSPKFLKQTKLVPLSLARQKYPRPSLVALKAAFNNSVSFIIVRHPFERLLSAYRDKLEFSLPHTYHRKLGNEIIAKYRHTVNKAKTFKHKWPTFSEFVMFLLDSVKNGQVLDMHWTPITEFCTPCMFNFDIIAHTETLQDDQEYLIQKAKLQNIIKPEWKNPGRGTTSQQIKIYYSQLTRAQILQLYHIYKYDFDLFNYSLKGYLELGKPDKDPSTLLDAINMKDIPRPAPAAHTFAEPLDELVTTKTTDP